MIHAARNRRMSNTYKILGRKSLRKEKQSVVLGVDGLNKANLATLVPLGR
jgi:hypothetical protein